MWFGNKARSLATSSCEVTSQALESVTHTHTHQFLQDCAPDPVNDGQPLVQWENRATTLTCLTMPVAAFWGEGFAPVAMFSAHVE